MRRRENEDRDSAGRSRHGEDRVSERDLRHGRKSEGRRRLLGAEILPVLSNNIKIRAFRVLRIHDVDDVATVGGFCEINGRRKRRKDEGVSEKFLSHPNAVVVNDGI